MADQLIRLNVLIASPGDVREEREAAVRAIDEINRLIEKEKVQLRARLWETDTVTQLGDRPQSIVNDQIADVCDIYVGVMWARVGTPTGEAESGTVEEYRRAKARFDNDPRSVRMLFFFCNRALPISVDVEQLVAVRKFQAEVEKLGLISTYTSVDEFGLKFRQAIHKHATDWGVSWGPETVASSESMVASNKSVSNELEEVGEEIGFLDAIEEAEGDLSEATKAMERISAAIEELGKSIERSTVDLSKQTQSSTFDLKALKRVSNQAAGHLENFSSRVAVDFPIMQKSLSNALDRLSDVVLLYQDFSTDGNSRQSLLEVRGTLSQLGAQIGQTHNSTVDFRQTIVDVPRMTTRFNGAKRQAGNVLAEFIEGMHESLRLITTIVEQIDDLGLDADDE